MEKAQAKAEVFELKEKLQNIQKDRDLIEAKAKTEMRVLAREIKSLRKSQPDLKEELEMVIKDKIKLQVQHYRSSMLFEDKHYIDLAEMMIFHHLYVEAVNCCICVVGIVRIQIKLDVL